MQARSVSGCKSCPSSGTFLTSPPEQKFLAELLCFADAVFARRDAHDGARVDRLFGVAVGHRRRAPWAVTAELTGRVGLAFRGAVYDPQECGCGTSNLGRDSFAVSLTAGVSLEK